MFQCVHETHEFHYRKYGTLKCEKYLSAPKFPEVWAASNNFSIKTFPTVCVFLCLSPSPADSDALFPTIHGGCFQLVFENSVLPESVCGKCFVRPVVVVGLLPIPDHRRRLSALSREWRLRWLLSPRSEKDDGVVAAARIKKCQTPRF